MTMPGTKPVVIQGVPAAPFKGVPSLIRLRVPTLTTPTDVGKAYAINDGTGTADIAYWTGTQWRYLRRCVRAGSAWFGP